MRETDSTLQRPILSNGSGRFSTRLKVFWPVKLVGTTAAMSAFFFLYFWVLQHPFFPVTLMPLTALDRWIPFQPWTLTLYGSLWLYVSLAVGLLSTWRELLAFAAVAAGLSVVGLAIFIFWPTAVPLALIDWAQHPGFEFLKQVDASGNACPSLHVAFAVFSAYALELVLRAMPAGPVARAFNGGWCLGIVYSTVAVRQHVALDVLAGAGLGGLGCALYSILLRRVPRKDRGI